MEGKRIVRSGLLAGEKIIVNGMERIRPGMPVTPQEQVAGQRDRQNRPALIRWHEPATQSTPVNL